MAHARTVNRTDAVNAAVIVHDVPVMARKQKIRQAKKQIKMKGW
jgi:hypothetical protein